ncbi:low specificity L-threonine aldolase-like [Dreissena polymorpha]|nr:low specificity L-threonine aldolase-like [Dreissena polymorpha]
MAYSSSSAVPVANGDQVTVIDFRSDTITRPSAGMRQAIAEAVVGDDVYGEDPTVNELQRRCAEMFGMEAALFVPTGTMGNLISILVHCRERGLEAIVGHKAHILLNEQAGIAQFAGVIPRTIQNLPDGTFDLNELRRLIRPTHDVHQPNTRMICLENSHNFCGGKALPLDFVKQVYQIAHENNCVVHTDGARILNAAEALGVHVSEILKYSDSVNMCFSKGLAAPVGSIIAGTREFIDKALRMRKGLGGGMRQVGILAAAALYSLEHVRPRLYEDHLWAAAIAKAARKAGQGVVHISEEGVDTNMVMFEVVKPGLTAHLLADRLLQVTEKEKEDLGESIVVKSCAISPMVTRVVTHNDLNTDMVAMAIKKISYVLEEFGKEE